MKKTPDNNYNDNFHHDNYTSEKREYVDISSGQVTNTKKFPWLKIISILFFSLIGTLGGAMIYAYSTLISFNYDDLSGDTSSDISSNSSENYSESNINDSMVLNVLLLGTDTRSTTDNGRSDTIMLASLDLRHKKIKLTSLMRDIWVTIPKHQKDRLNAAYSYGGPKLAIETIQQNFGVAIDRYASVDFESFAKIVDHLGGIDMELTSQEVAYLNTHSGSPNKLRGSGVKHLDGLQALNHARNRDSLGSDYDRTQRQRNVIETILNKMKEANLSQITKIISDVAPMITTNFKPSEITKLATNSLTYLNFEVEQFRLPTNDNVKNATIDQKMVLVINDMEKAKKDLSKFIYEEYSTK